MDTQLSRLSIYLLRICLLHILFITYLRIYIEYIAAVIGGGIPAMAKA